ncbi:hypothetical protein Tco_1290685 [Tanacetum coccineum]
MPGFGYGPCGQHKIMFLQDGTELRLCGTFFYKVRIDTEGIESETSYREASFPRKNVVHQLDLMTDLLGAPSAEAIARVLKALNEIKSTFGWRVVCAWIGNDPCGDGDLPAWSSITCSTQSDDSVVSQLLL